MTSADPRKSLGGRTRTLFALPLVLPIELYRRFVSPLIPARCRYYPTCSSYAVEALKTYGPLRGSVLAAWRIVRCNPWSDGGVDLVADQRLFRRHRHGADCVDSHNHHSEVVA